MTKMILKMAWKRFYHVVNEGVDEVAAALSEL